MTTQRFPRGARLLAKPEFDRVFAQGIRLRSELLRLHALPAPQGGARLGLAIAKRNVPDSVDRNRIKRHLREAFRRQRASLPAYEFVVHATPAAIAAAGPALQADFRKLLERVPSPAAPR